MLFYPFDLVEFCSGIAYSGLTGIRVNLGPNRGEYSLISMSKDRDTLAFILQLQHIIAV